VRASVRRVRESSLLPESFGVTGFVYDVKSGRLNEVAA
jgi:carbonic anhydrase